MKDSIYSDCLEAKARAQGSKRSIWPDLAKKHGYENGEKLRSAFRREQKKRGDNLLAPAALYEYRADGSIMLNKFLMMTEEDAKSPRRVLEIAGFNPDEWKIRVCRVNAWNAQRPKDAGQLINHQVRLDVEPKQPSEISIDDIRNFFKNYNPNAQPKKVKAKQYSLSGKMLEICLADLHNARMLADPNAKTPDENLQETIQDIKGRAKGKRFSVVYLVPLGDLTDADNMKATTTNGTQQYLIMTPYQMIDSAASMMIWAVDQLREVAPVKYVFIPGNHDEIISFAIAKILEAHYRKENDVMINTGHDPHKWDTFGVNLIGWTHGQLPKGQAFSWLQSKARKEWGNTKYSEVHSGHTHTQTVEEKAGQIIRYLPSTADASLWENGQGYGSVKSTASFVWDAANGLQEQWFTNLI